jgi:hypothetical protein
MFIQGISNIMETPVVINPWDWRKSTLRFKVQGSGFRILGLENQNRNSNSKAKLRFSSGFKVSGKNYNN